ncbi:MAG: orotidine-5'-phosphate decarboxylase [Gemmatimonadaceae bacterium]|nr:orotidine-5'-phosphate decarboxylase [Gemmatimonadaceae bacterium]
MSARSLDESSRAIPIVALDVSSAAEALALAGRLGESCRYYKVGSELFTAAGPHVVSALREQGHRVFLDLKLHDIPNTVRGAARAAARLGASLLTVHASGGGEMMRAAVEGAGEECGILAVTVLTSLDAASLSRAWGREATLSIEDEVARLAALAAEAGAHGIVCSGHEAARVRAAYGERLQPLVPGIRFASGEVHDQSRVVTPGGAVKAGARYLVLGRAVTEAGDPAGAMRRVWEEIGGAG